VWMDQDLNKYDCHRRGGPHAQMSDAEWDEGHRSAWFAYFTPGHVRTILRPSAPHPHGRPNTTPSTLHWFYVMFAFEGVHPLEGGALRLKFRRDRRFGMPLESPFVFYPRYWAETAGKLWRYWRLYRKFKPILDEALNAPDRAAYSDLAIAPPK